MRLRLAKHHPKHALEIHCDRNHAKDVSSDTQNPNATYSSFTNPAENPSTGFFIKSVRCWKTIVLRWVDQRSHSFHTQKEKTNTDDYQNPSKQQILPPKEYAHNGTHSQHVLEHVKLQSDTPFASPSECPINRDTPLLVIPQSNQRYPVGSKLLTDVWTQFYVVKQCKPLYQREGNH